MPITYAQAKAYATTVTIMHKRNLPHIYPVGADFFVTFRLKNSIPLAVLEQLKAMRDRQIMMIAASSQSQNAKYEAIYAIEKRFFANYDQALHQFTTQENVLWKPEVAQIVADKLHELDGKYYDLLAYCIMPNHVHLLFSLYDYEHSKMSAVMKSIKGSSAYLCNKLLGKSGALWQQESYDHYVRSAKELQNIEHYIVENPVKAGFLEDWQQWKFTYWKK